MNLIQCADLEITLHRHGAEAELPSYEVDFRFSLPGAEAETRLNQSRPALVSFDLAALRASGPGWEDYGHALTQQLFTSQVQEAFLSAAAAASAMGLPLRLRMMIGGTAPELHALRWETLRDPRSGGLLCTSERILFSRYLSSADWRQVRLRSKSELRALALVASPTNLSASLAVIDSQQEIEKIRAALGEIPLDTLPGTWAGRGATLDDLDTSLREMDYDILYIVCHGFHRSDGTHLLLEDGQGLGVDTPGSQLAERLIDLSNRPRLVVLVSCESAGSGMAGVLNTLAGTGPLLAEAGIPAVIAMQSPVSFETMESFAPVFFRELSKDGTVDRAFAAARAAVRDRFDAWVPVLFMRLKTGRLWYVPGFGERGGESRVWPLLLLRLKSYLTRPNHPDAVTPVIGHGIIEPVIGSLHDIARRWSDQHHYPMAPHERDSLPQVAQYLATTFDDDNFPYLNLEESLRQGLLSAYSSLLLPDHQEDTLDSLVVRVGAERFKDPCEPHVLLASLPLPVYLTANIDRLLEDALEKVGKHPETVLCPWFRDADQEETVYDREKYVPDKDRPLVYHLFGRLDRPESLVLTEDNYFDYLLGVARNKHRIPKDVLRALASSTLLFIGFQLQDWNFRVLLRSMLALSGESQERRPINIAAQIEPDESRIIEPGRARSYIEKYFTHDAKVSLYWGSVDDFMKELYKRWTKA